jgi:hypothetical protein
MARRAGSVTAPWATSSTSRRWRPRSPPSAARSPRRSPAPPSGPVLRLMIAEAPHFPALLQPPPRNARSSTPWPRAWPNSARGASCTSPTRARPPNSSACWSPAGSTPVPGTGPGNSTTRTSTVWPPGACGSSCGPTVHPPPVEAGDVAAGPGLDSRALTAGRALTAEGPRQPPGVGHCTLDNGRALSGPTSISTAGRPRATAAAQLPKPPPPSPNPPPSPKSPESKSPPE